jgi:hypothetical protein
MFASGVSVGWRKNSGHCKRFQLPAQPSFPTLTPQPSRLFGGTGSKGGAAARGSGGSRMLGIPTLTPQPPKGGAAARGSGGKQSPLYKALIFNNITAFCRGWVFPL